MNICKRFPTGILLKRLIFQEIAKKKFHNLIEKNVNITSKIGNLQPKAIIYDGCRHKSNKRQNDSDDEEELFDDDITLNKDSKVVKFNTTSLRTDAILKLALGVSRNKVEQAFYESKIRVNGKKIIKKSFSVKVGDELDIIKMVSPKNPEHLYVSRIEVLNATANEENITITARRFKNLLLENYDEDPYKAGSGDGE